ncbi:MAG: alkylphosphonate utilization protein [Proteobacteria bacterium]|nr:MAG: alkylphosphonate utilization protein [Pseudomonadota bacterium]
MKCQACESEHVYEDRGLFICPECAAEWSSSAIEVGDNSPVHDGSVRDAHGNVLVDGDSVTVLKDLKIKGSSSVVKVGTKVKGIRLIEGADDHNIACKIEGFGAMNLKSEFVKKT